MTVFGLRERFRSNPLFGIANSNERIEDEKS
jgi:hypothetical protein